MALDRVTSKRFRSDKSSNGSSSGAVVSSTTSIVTGTVAMKLLAQSSVTAYRASTTVPVLCARWEGVIERFANWAITAALANSQTTVSSSSVVNALKEEAFHDAGKSPSGSRSETSCPGRYKRLWHQQAQLATSGCGLFLLLPSLLHAAVAPPHPARYTRLWPPPAQLATPSCGVYYTRLWLFAIPSQPERRGGRLLSRALSPPSHIEVFRPAGPERAPLHGRHKDACRHL